MTAVAITGMGLTGVLRLTRVYDNLAHVEDHSHTAAEILAIEVVESLLATRGQSAPRS